MTPRILVIAGSDSGGGAGIQADIKTITMLGGHAMTAVTAITAQNTLGVQAVMPVPTDMVMAQIESVVGDIGVDAVKIGMLGSAETAAAVADWLLGIDVPIVFDPVMVATSGDVLADVSIIAAFERLIKIATVSTPNVEELRALSGIGVLDDLGVHDAAGGLAEMLNTAILATGTRIEGGHVGHVDTDGLLFDRLFVSDPVSGFEEWEWHAPIIDTNQDHGTGCTLASAIALGLAHGLALPTAVATARTFVRLALHGAPGLGGGHGPMGHQTVRLDLGAGPRLNQATLPGDAASIAFYAALGLTRIVATDHGYARFETPGGATLSVEPEAAPTLFLECDDLDAALATLATRGIHASAPIDQPWGWREARLTDPAGNALCLYRAGEMRRFPPWRVGA